jgi:hypothetical protein
VRRLVAPAPVAFLGEVVIEVLDEQPGADLAEFAMAGVYRVHQLDAGQAPFETVEQRFDAIAMREQLIAKMIRMFDVGHD